MAVKSPERTLSGSGNSVGNCSTHFAAAAVGCSNLDSRRTVGPLQSVALSVWRREVEPNMVVHPLPPAGQGSTEQQKVTDS